MAWLAPILAGAENNGVVDHDGPEIAAGAAEVRITGLFDVVIAAVTAGTAGKTSLRIAMHALAA